MNVALVHGGAQGAWVWDDCIAALRLQSGERLGTVVALDVPGCGSKAGVETGGLGVADVARLLIDEIEATGGEDFLLVGHSQAGQLLPEMVRLRPGLFRHVVHVACIAPAPGQTLAELRGTAIQGTDPDTIGFAVDFASVSREEFMRITFAGDMAPAQFQGFLARLGRDAWPAAFHTERGWDYHGLRDVPSTYVLCLQDRALPPEWQLRCADRLGVDRIVRVDAAHQVMVTRPHALAEILLTCAAG